MTGVTKILLAAVLVVVVAATLVWSARSEDGILSRGGGGGVAGRMGRGGLQGGGIVDPDQRPGTLPTAKLTPEYQAS